MCDQKKMNQFGFLTENQLKLIAVISMLIDHIGAELFPQITILRVIGRLAFPIFSFSIYEGCKHTHAGWKYLMRVFLMGLFCVVGYYIYSRRIFGNVLITFSLSICILLAFRFLKAQVHRGVKWQICSGVLLLFCLGGAYGICTWVQIDYGFCGVLLPVFAELFDGFSQKKRYVPLLGFGIGLLLLSIQKGGVQYFSLFSLLLLAAYNGNRGTRNLKAFFYWFYPIHLLVIGAVAMILHRE